MKQKITIIKNSQLKPHERVIKTHLRKIYAWIKSDGFINDPLIVDKNTNIVLDGHHRYLSLILLGVGSSPVYLC